MLELDSREIISHIFRNSKSNQKMIYSKINRTKLFIIEIIEIEANICSSFCSHTNGSGVNHTPELYTTHFPFQINYDLCDSTNTSKCKMTQNITHYINAFDSTIYIAIGTIATTLYYSRIYSNRFQLPHNRLLVFLLVCQC